MKMQRFWIRIRVWWHIGTTLLIVFCSLVYWFHDVSAYGGRIDMLETKQQKNEGVLNRMDYNIQIIAGKVGVTPLQKPTNE